MLVTAFSAVVALGALGGFSGAKKDGVQANSSWPSVAAQTDVLANSSWPLVVAHAGTADNSSWPIAPVDGSGS
ncbi:hypothetical protein ACH4UM_32815 [Streptomyces sp. NPDC020801]|uniref:hypothetical protein n=1 Tax=unclassified Streptomyces TaxID=2593676 RepID=UPI0037893061